MPAVTESQDVQPLRIGTVLDGRYRIDAALGAGAMGCVYRGEHVGIGRTVAIKVLRSDLGGSQDATRRFKREALASGRLEHPNIVGVSDFGVLDDGSSYLVMEALRGESLGERLERDGRIPWSEAVELLRGILRGLHHAHQRGVVHRDIKPDNIFLTEHDGRCVVKLLDFGIAKLVAGNAEDPASTRAGLTMGTPRYLSPEQAVGGEITRASDLYSATVVLFEMLTGRAPFEEPDLVATMVAHISKPPPALSEIAPEIAFPLQLETIIQHGLQKLSAERIPSAVVYLELLDAIEGHISRMSGTFSAPYDVATMTSIADAGGSIPRKWLVRGAIVLGATVMLAIVVGAAGSGSGQAPATRDAARASFVIDARPETNEPAPAIDAVVVEAPVATVDRELQMKALLHDLANGRTCEDRRTAIAKLVELDDPKAIPTLKAARHRMRGGVMGFRQGNTNACLAKDADAAIKTLGRTR